MVQEEQRESILKTAEQTVFIDNDGQRSAMDAESALKFSLLSFHDCLFLLSPVFVQSTDDPFHHEFRGQWSDNYLDWKK